ncbi:2,5-diketo-D-gluconic acid reductase [Erysipelothrix larvae]|uniref:2,5-diketo-D-gluconic acid reductase n=1 Tax=Erysipelothrix larvae TaxID=1514105 RepID=A0A109UHC0_9FIRM|nr:aldo/keto reductase [Erysipelothrix larvae]AMC94048.1 2,5-diketo-D-gluconic acid reductase [Erysipelothrix larvae]
MEYVTLNNGVLMPAVGFGVFQINDHDQCVQSVLDAIECGYRLIDTAQSYGNEKAVGEALRKTNVAREDLFITTKVWISNAGYDKAYQSILKSMDDLGVSYIDCVLIHQPLNDVYGTYRAMTQLYNEGKIRAIGVSNFYPDRLADFAMCNDIIPTINQIEVNPFHQQLKALEINEKFGVCVQAWAPFAEGQHDIFNNPVLASIGSRVGKTNAQVILRWLMQRNIVPLAKTVNKSRMKENLDIFDFSLTEEDMSLIATLNTDKSSFFDHQTPEAVERLLSLVRNV